MTPSLDKIDAKPQQLWRIEAGEMGNSVVTTGIIEGGTEVYGLIPVKLLDQPTTYTVQLAEGKHAEISGGAEFTSHSCEPNCYLSVSDGGDDGVPYVKFVTMRRLQPGELISFNYNTTEWDMASPFQCVCGTPSCVGMVRGFKYASPLQRERLRPLLSPYITAKMQESN